MFSQSYHVGIEIENNVGGLGFVAGSLNRTMLELKFNSAMLFSAFIISLNRTMLELK